MKNRNRWQWGVAVMGLALALMGPNRAVGGPGPAEPIDDPLDPVEFTEYAATEANVGCAVNEAPTVEVDMDPSSTLVPGSEEYVVSNPTDKPRDEWFKLVVYYGDGSKHLYAIPVHLEPHTAIGFTVTYSEPPNGPPSPGACRVGPGGTGDSPDPIVHIQPHPAPPPGDGDGEIPGGCDPGAICFE